MDWYKLTGIVAGIAAPFIGFIHWLFKISRRSEEAYEMAKKAEDSLLSVASQYASVDKKVAVMETTAEQFVSRFTDGFAGIHDQLDGVSRQVAELTTVVYQLVGAKNESSHRPIQAPDRSDK